MGNLDSEGSDTDIDLESGGNTSEEDGRIVQDLSADHGKKVLRRTWSGFVGLNRSARVGNGLNSYDEVSISSRASADNVSIISDQLAKDFVDSLEKKVSKEKKKTSNSKNPSKPPRPPKGPLLDAVDMKYVKEFSELARLKRRRVDRMNKLKKKRSEQESSSSSNIIAMVVTCVFGLVIIFHGLLGSRV